MKYLIFALSLIALSGCKKEKDPCEGVVCQNGGTCVDGSCSCPAHWSGPDCSIQVTPVLITIHGIEITKMPATDAAGAGWDLTSGPDIFVVIKQNGTVIASTENQWKQNSGVGTSWGLDLGITATLSPITIELWDYDDFDANDYMGGIVGPVYSSTGGFPQLINLDCGSCTVAVRLGPIEYL